MVGAQTRAVHKLTNQSSRPVVVILEPWGGEYDIDPQQALELIIEGRLDAPCLTIISNGPDLAITRDGKPVAAR
jgi:hypothetical protein